MHMYALLLPSFQLSLSSLFCDAMIRMVVRIRIMMLVILWVMAVPVVRITLDDDDINDSGNDVIHWDNDEDDDSDKDYENNNDRVKGFDEDIFTDNIKKSECNKGNCND